MVKTLLGGDDSKPRSEYSHGFFHKEASVSFQLLRTKKNDIKMLRILPAFDPNADLTTTKGKESFIPFMDANNQLTSWFFYVSGYTFLGEKNKQFISPIVFESKEDRFSARGVDPIRDCYLYAKRHDDEDIKALTSQKTRNSPAIIPAPRDFVLFNAYVTKTDGTSDVSVVIATKTAMKDLEEQLGWRAGRGDPIISEDFSELLYGDPTDPMTGLSLFVVEKQSASSNSYSYPGLSFSTKKQTLEGVVKQPIDPESAEGKEILRKRYNIADVANITYIPSYQEMLEYIVAFTDIPYEIILDACSPYCNNIPESRRVKTSKSNTEVAQAANSSFGSVPAYEEEEDDIFSSNKSQIPSEPINKSEEPSVFDAWSDEMESEFLLMQKQAESEDPTVVSNFYADSSLVSKYFELKKLRKSRVEVG